MRGRLIRSATAGDPDALSAYAERRLAFALRRFEDRAHHVVVRMSDTNGPRRGVDSRCSITLQMRDGKHIDVEAVTAWPFASVSLAAKRLNEVLRRKLDKSQVSGRRHRRSELDAFSGA